MIALILVPEEYTYSGASAVILGANFINISMLMWIKNSSGLIDVDTFLDQMCLENLSMLDWKSKVNYFKMETQNSHRLSYLANILFYFGTLIAFAIINAAQLEYITRIGWMHAGIIFFSDFSILYYRSKLGDVLVNKYVFKSALMLFNRLVLCFQPEHWLAMQSVVFFVTASVVIAVKISNLLVREKDSFKQSTHYLY